MCHWTKNFKFKFFCSLNCLVWDFSVSKCVCLREHFLFLVFCIFSIRRKFANWLWGFWILCKVDDVIACDNSSGLSLGPAWFSHNVQVHDTIVARGQSDRKCLVKQEIKDPSLSLGSKDVWFVRRKRKPWPNLLSGYKLWLEWKARAKRWRRRWGHVWLTLARLTICRGKMAGPNGIPVRTTFFKFNFLNKKSASSWY